MKPSPFATMTVPEIMRFLEDGHKALHDRLGCPPGCACPVRFVTIVYDGGPHIIYAAENKSTGEVKRLLLGVANALGTAYDTDLSKYLKKRE